MATFVPAQLTKADGATVRDALIAGHVSAVGEVPTYNRVGVAWSQVMLETGNGASMWNHNFGNIKCTPSYGGTCCTLPLDPSSSEPAAQRAYPSIVEGAADYWRLLTGSRYAAALPLFDAGKPYEAGIMLGGLGWFTAPPHDYGATMSALFTKYVATWPHGKEEPPPASSWGEENKGLIVGAAILVGIGAVAWVLNRPEMRS